jgi:hypothetical protein
LDFFQCDLQVDVLLAQLLQLKLDNHQLLSLHSQHLQQQQTGLTFTLQHHCGIPVVKGGRHALPSQNTRAFTLSTMLLFHALLFAAHSRHRTHVACLLSAHCMLFSQD